MEPTAQTPIQRDNSSAVAEAFPGLEAALRDACRRALLPALTFATLLALYRSVVDLTRSLRQARQDVGLPSALSADLRARLDAVRDAAGGYFVESDLPMDDAVRLHRALAALSRAAHLAQGRPVRVRRTKADQTKAPRVISQRQSKLLATTSMAALLSPAAYKAKSHGLESAMLEAAVWLDHAGPFQRDDRLGQLMRGSPFTVAHAAGGAGPGFLPDRNRDFGIATVDAVLQKTA